MAGAIKKILKSTMVAILVPMAVFAVQQRNPRGSAVSARNNAYSQESQNNAQIRRSATSVIARNVSANNRKKRPVVTARPATVQDVKARGARSVVSNGVKSRAANNGGVVRSVVPVKKTTNTGSRAGMARATAVFNDVTKIGTGYAACRDAYATCMDQFCANANDTYRRCYCSDRFQDFRDTSDRLDTALKMLTEFQNNNLNAVDKTAAEVSAMYTATAGEAAIKKDTSASQRLLDSISSVLSGKQNIQKQNTGLNSLGILDFSGFGGSDDIWGGDSSSVFGGDSTTNLAELEGKALYNNVTKQCAEIIREACGSDAMFNLARSSYSILISQDCNAYEKNINAKKASVEDTIRTAEKYLRDARLEEYRSHNSADVNECLANVEKAMRQPVTCGENYEKCMDYTGQYINVTTGEPIFSQALFGLNKLIVLNGSADVLGGNADFNKYLDGKRVFAETALNSCRDIADTVWYEFKRSALIQIAQAQDERIQQIKDSCVTTIKECYDTQTGALKGMDSTEISSTGAIAAATARGMCYDRVQACAALYGDPNGCKYDDNTKKLEDAGGEKKCGLKALLTFVDTVDAAKVAEGCEVALTKYAHELCDPKIGSDADIVYPMGCATMPKSELRAAMNLRTKTFCAKDLVDNDASRTIQGDATAFNLDTMNQVIKSIYDELGIAFTAGCEDDKEIKGKWVSANEISNPNIASLKQSFYKKYYGVEITNINQINDFNLAEVGWCVDSSSNASCEVLLGMGYVNDTDTCTLNDRWYNDMCQMALGGHMENDQCHIDYTHATVSAD